MESKQPRTDSFFKNVSVRSVFSERLILNSTYKANNFVQCYNMHWVNITMFRKNGDNNQFCNKKHHSYSLKRCRMVLFE